jgi:hypothetical protein
LPGSKLLSFASAKESNQSRLLRGTLRCSTGQAAAGLALRAQTALADTPDQPALLGGARGNKKQKILCALRVRLLVLMPA